MVMYTVKKQHSLVKKEYYLGHELMHPHLRNNRLIFLVYQLLLPDTFCKLILFLLNQLICKYFFNFEFSACKIVCSIRVRLPNLRIFLFFILLEPPLAGIIITALFLLFLLNFGNSFFSTIKKHPHLNFLTN